MLRRLGVIGAAGGLALAGGIAASQLAAGPRIVVLPFDEDSAREEASRYGQLPVVTRDQWGALPVNFNARNEKGIYAKDSNPEGWYVYAGDLRASYQSLVIHHSAFYKADGLATLLEVQRLHRNDRGWADIGYHFLVDKIGTIFEGRDLAARGVHTQGYNTGSAGVCLLGDFRTAAPTGAQWAAAAALSAWLVERLALTHLAGHSQFNQGTACPGTTLLEKLPDLAETAGVEYGTAGYVPAAGSADCDCCNCQTQL